MRKIQSLEETAASPRSRKPADGLPAVLSDEGLAKGEDREAAAALTTTSCASPTLARAWRTRGDVKCRIFVRGARPVVGPQSGISFWPRAGELGIWGSGARGG